MAIIKSPVWSEARGSIGGTTYARNKSGLYARNRSKPVNPNTVKQSAVRSQFQTNAFAFSNLSVEEVNAWNQYAQGYPAINKVGDTYTPSGKQVFMLCNQNLLSIGADPITTPPSDFPIVPNITLSDLGLVVAASAGPPYDLTTMGMHFASSDLDTAVIVVQMTPNLMPARQSYRNRMRQIGFATQATTTNVAAAWKAYFGDPLCAPGQIINIRQSAVDPGSGVASAWVYIQAVLPEGT